MKFYLLSALVLIVSSSELFGQCALLNQLRDKRFVADGQCAPVNVTNLSVTYNFSVAQNPNDIVIRFIWNDPANTITNINLASGLVVDNADRRFSATGTFTYLADDNCFFEAEVYIVVDGNQCESSQELSIIQAWDDDDDFGGVMSIDPNGYQICENNAVANLVFTDNSTFNCNPNISPNNPNELTRHTQFVYGTNHNPAASLLNVTLNGGAIQLTDATGGATMTTTQGTAGEVVTGLYFGAITPVDFPAQAPNNISLPISADASALGSSFEVTLFNWNVCNEYNGDVANPNYEDAVREVVLIEVVDEPVVDYQTRLGDASGPVKTIFCIGEEIYFENQTVNANAYQWEFYDDAAGLNLLATQNANNPTYTYFTGGEKRITLKATNTNVNGDCDVVYSETRIISPDAVSNFQIFDASFTNIVEPSICESTNTLLEIGFRDATTSVQPQTEWRYEFYDFNGALLSTQPADGSYSSTSIPDFTKSYTTVGVEIVRLVARNNVTLCESIFQDTMVVYGLPTAQFMTDSVCEGNRTSFSSISDSLSIPQRVNDDYIDTWQWDYSYETVFKQELTVNDDSAYAYYLDGTDRFAGSEPATSSAGEYVAALKVTTAKGGCESLTTNTVVVHANPSADIDRVVSGELCPGDELVLNNNSTPISALNSYDLRILHMPSAFSQTIQFNTTDTTWVVFNPDDSIRTYKAVLEVVSSEGCNTISDTLTFQVNPNEEADFSDPNLSFISSNCSTWDSQFLISQSTQDLNAESYEWIILDGSDTIVGFPLIKLSADPDFDILDYQLANTTTTIKTYQAILSATKTGLCIASDTVTFQISPQPSANFTIEREDNCETVTLTLEGQEVGLAEYDWTLSSTPIMEDRQGNSLEVSYQRMNTDLSVEAQLVTTNLASCTSDTISQSFIIQQLQDDINAAFSLSTDTLKLPDDQVAITNLSSMGSGLMYAWDFADGSVDSTANPLNHTYSAFGSYEILLTVYNDFCSSSFTQTLIVLPADPIIDFVADTLVGCAPLTVTFQNLSQFTELGKHLWEFGDGSISRADEPVFTYFSPGTYTVRLRGQNEVGMTDENEKVAYITVYGVPFADFLATPRTVYIPDQEVFFRNLSENIVSQYWEFGDGDTSTEFEPRHSYLEEGQYDILLAVENEVGCVDTLFRPAEVTAVIGGNVKSPNAFTPSLAGPTGGNVGISSNQDPGRINDVFLPSSEGVTSFKMWVYNKWGQLLFKSEDQFTGWDGYFNGKLAPAGVYVYKLDLQFSDGREEVKVGDVTLVR